MKIALFFALLVIYGGCSYLIGWHNANEIASKEWYEGPVGYCFADKPPHPGECHE